MKPFLYLPEADRSYFKNQIEEYWWVYNNKLNPVFSNIAKDADEAEKEAVEKLGKQFEPDGFIDEGMIYELAHDRGLNRYLVLELGHYNLLCAVVSTLSHMWEQQLTVFLYDQVSRICKIDLSDFAQDFRQIKTIFQLFGVDIGKLDSWNKLQELRLLNNYIKHGEGSSAKRLRKKYPKYFHDVKTGLHKQSINKSTLLKAAINIEELDVEVFFDAVMKFWDEFPERAELTCSEQNSGNNG